MKGRIARDLVFDAMELKRILVEHVQGVHSHTKGLQAASQIIKAMDEKIDKLLEDAYWAAADDAEVP